MLEGGRGVRNVPNSCCKGASAGCCCCCSCCRVQLLEWRVRSGAGLQVLQLKWRVRFGVGMLVPLQDAAAGCCCRIFLRSSRRRSALRVVAKKRLLTKQFWSCKCTKVQNWEVWGMIRAWFGVWFRNPFLLNSGSFVAWVFFSHRQPTTIPDLNMKNAKI